MTSESGQKKKDRAIVSVAIPAATMLELKRFSRRAGLDLAIESEETLVRLFIAMCFTLLGVMRRGTASSLGKGIQAAMPSVIELLRGVGAKIGPDTGPGAAIHDTAGSSTPRTVHELRLAMLSWAGQVRDELVRSGSGDPDMLAELELWIGGLRQREKDSEDKGGPPPIVTPYSGEAETSAEWESP